MGECRFRGVGRASLRVKIKSLAAEAKIIRQEAKRYPGNSSERGCLNWHRISVVRNEARAAQLAYAFLRNIPYSVVESKGSKPVDVSRVSKLAEKYGYWYVNGRHKEEGVLRWLAGEKVEKPLPIKGKITWIKTGDE